MIYKFDWDIGNLEHVMNDHPERENTVDEVESVFSDTNLFLLPNRVDEHGEFRYIAIGIGASGDEKTVVFVTRKDKMRPISCRRANKKERVKYYENIIKNL